MKEFMGEEFLLNTETAINLYKVAKELPIIDFHCHLNTKEIFENRRYKNITEIWLGEDHYKWRAMRSYGIEEKYITGDASDFDKFKKWAETVENCIGNPLYHWTHLELKRYFGIEIELSSETASEIWNICNEKIKNGDLDVRKLIEKSKVQYIGTTDDPLDTLEYHKALRLEGVDFKVAPTFRPDKVLKIRKEGFKEYIKKLGGIELINIENISDLIKTLEKRVEHFVLNDCKISDHSLEEILISEYSFEKANDSFKKVLSGLTISLDEEKYYFTFVFIELSKLYCKYDLVMQLHIGALRNNNTKMLKKIGPDSGFDSINDISIAENLSKILDSLNTRDILPRTILYCLNPKDNEVIGTMIGNFQEGKGISKIQFGSGWWFNDQKDGMQRQLTALSHLGLLSKFVGMLTDSRSFLSYIRHEYFRRILCNYIGKIVENGEYPNNIRKLEEIVSNICYFNSKEYFKIE